MLKAIVEKLRNLLQLQPNGMILRLRILYFFAISFFVSNVNKTIDKKRKH